MALTNDEKKVLDLAEQEYFSKGVVTVKCPKCKGSIIVEEIYNSYTVECENGCLKRSIRGI